MAEERVGIMLEKQRQASLMQKEEFDRQVGKFAQREEEKVKHKKEQLIENQDFWKQQIKWSEARKLQNKVIDLSGGTQPTFLKKMFKYQENLDVVPGELDITEVVPVGEVAISRQQRSRMNFSKHSVLKELLDQIEQKEAKKMDEKIKDREHGIKMVQKAEESQQMEEMFLEIKKKKTIEVMKKHWEEQLKIKSNQQIVDKIFS